MAAAALRALVLVIVVAVAWALGLSSLSRRVMRSVPERPSSWGRVLRLADLARRDVAPMLLVPERQPIRRPGRRVLRLADLARRDVAPMLLMPQRQPIRRLVSLVVLSRCGGRRLGRRRRRRRRNSGSRATARAWWWRRRRRGRRCGRGLFSSGGRVVRRAAHRARRCRAAGRLPRAAARSCGRSDSRSRVRLRPRAMVGVLGRRERRHDDLRHRSGAGAGVRARAGTEPERGEMTWPRVENPGQCDPGDDERDHRHCRDASDCQNSAPLAGLVYRQCLLLPFRKGPSRPWRRDTRNPFTVQPGSITQTRSFRRIHLQARRPCGAAAEDRHC
jgi:hypothetical protein